MNTRIGISGWTYPPWRGVFYPEGLAQKRELEYASRQVNTIEINGTFYSMQRPESFQKWYDATPPDFIFAVKGSRFITHMKKLKDVDAALANFFAQGVLRLADKLGPILWQFPEQMRFDAAKFDAFMRMLPADTTAAAKLAKKHDHRLNDRAWTRAVRRQPIRHAFEIRHESFLCDEFVALLREHGAALVFADSAGKWPYVEDVTADFVYLRLHGSTQLYTSGYTDPELDRWARRVKSWQAGSEPRDATRIAGRDPDPQPRGAFIYFDNDAKVHAPFDAMKLRGRLAPARGKRRSARKS